jgi:hypothetical protein
MADRHDQNTEDSYPREVDFTPAPELFDPAALQAEIEASVNPEGNR